MQIQTETEAWVVPSQGSSLELQILPLPPLKDHEVQIHMKLCGLCHTDIHMKNNDWGISNYPMVPGHEGVGVVSAVGSQVSSLKVGDVVGVGWIRDSCGSCDSCCEGKENLCAAGYQGTYLSSHAGCWGRKDYSLGGCFARYMQIHERFAFKLPDSIPPEQAAPLMCAGVTVWEPIISMAKPGSTVGVISLGGLGHMAVKLLNAIGASVVVLSSTENKRQKALELHASQYVNYNAPEDMKLIQGSLDLIIDTCPVAPQTLSSFMNCLKFGGTYVRVGIPSNSSDAFGYNFIPLVFTGKAVKGSIVCGSKNTKTMLRIAGEHKIVSDVEVVSFDLVNQVMEKLIHGQNEASRYVLSWSD